MNGSAGQQQHTRTAIGAQMRRHSKQTERRSWRVRALVIVGVLALIAGACSSSDEGSPTSTSEGETGSTTESGGSGDLTLEVWTHEFAPLQDALLEKWIPEFEAANPGIKIENTTIPVTGVVSFDAKLLASLSGGQGPDLWEMGSWNVPEFIDNEFVASIDPEAFGYGSAEEMIEAYNPGTLELFSRDGEIYAIFSEYNVLGLYYNKDVFEDAGIAPLPTDRPISWDEALAIGGQLSVYDGEVPERLGWQWNYNANFRSPEWVGHNFYPQMRQLGQQDVYVNGEAAANTPAVVGALATWEDSIQTHRTYDGAFFTDFFADFANGRGGMTMAGTWFVPAIRDLQPDVNFGVAPTPVMDPTDKSSWVGSQWSFSWSVNANSTPEEQAASQDFLAFILGKKGEIEQALWWFENVGYVQPLRAMFASDEYQAIVDSEPWLEAFNVTLQDYTLAYNTHVKDEAALAIVRAVDRVVFDGTSAEEAADILQAELERLGG